jgi:amidohydrolase
MTLIDATTRQISRNTSALRSTIQQTVGQWHDRLVTLSHAIHDHPETAFEEHHAADLVARALGQAGFDTSVGVYGLPTAVEATYGSGDFTVVLCAEYDALPGIGHACGHNIIATAGVGAAIALAAVAERAGIRVKLLGTPAEEHGGGKVLMLQRGAWEDATISLMVHGSPGVDLACGDFTSQAVDRFDITYEGRPAHAAAAPHAGINAADAATVALVAIGLLRQQLAGTVRVAAFVADGGEVTNIIPARTVVKAEVRSFDLGELNDAKRRVLACFEAGATASGCTWSAERTQPRYANLVQEPMLSGVWNEALAELGRPTVPMQGLTGGSTDMGNVSHVVPSIHPAIAVHGSVAPPHTREFATDARTPEADQAAVDAAIALAWTALDAAVDPEKRTELLQRQSHRVPGATTVSQDGE